MKTLSLIPKKLIDIYQIEKINSSIMIHSPAHVNIDIDDEFKIKNNGYTYLIGNSKVCACIWENIQMLHITIF